LSDQLWKKVQGCYSMFEDEDGDGKADSADIIDDSSNGYLKVSGSFPTCGCSCETTVGAFKKDDDTYLFLGENTLDCNWTQEITANYDLKDVFSFHLESDGFFSKNINNNSQSATFYIDMEIPREGTNTKIWIKTIPFGITMESNKNIAFGYSAEDEYAISSSKINQITDIHDIANNIEHPQTLQHLLNNEFENISSNDIEVIKKTINSDNSDRLENKEELVDVLKELKQKYDLYTKIEHEWLLLGWDRSSGSFYIKEKGGTPKKISFVEFLKEAEYWVAAC